MRFFPLFFLSVLLFLHGYMYINLRRAFGSGAWRYAALAFLALSFFLIYFQRRWAMPADGEILTRAAMLWMALLIIMGLIMGIRDALHIAACLADKISGAHVARFFAGARSMRLALGIGLLAYGWALYEATGVRIRTLTVKTPLLPAHVERLRIVSLTDLHVTSGTSVATIDRIVDLANAQKPDITVIVGDYLDGHFDAGNPQAEALSKLRGPAGRFAVLGNHETFGGLSSAVRFIGEAGFTLLRGQSVEAGGIVVAGVDDPRVPGRTEIFDALQLVPTDRFVLLLSHRPEAPADAVGLFDLELSGHTHGGQVWPMRHIVKYIHGFGQGLTVLEAPEGRPRRRSLVHVSNGTRHWGPPIRFLTPPEIIVVDLVREGENAGEKAEETIR